jgi:hypothetical protein
MRKAFAAAVLSMLAGSAMAAPQTVTFADPNIFPESITALPDGTVIAGGMLTHFIYRARPGAATAERWIDLTSMGSAAWGVLADGKSNTLYACTAEFPLPAKITPPIKERHTSLRAFNLKTGALKASWALQGKTNSCNDITVGPDGSIYVSDIGNGEIQRLKHGAEVMDVWLKTPELASVDGIVFNGRTLYVSNVSTSKIYRIPIHADGTGAAPVEVTLSQPLKGPDGVRAWKGKLYVAENGSNQISELTLKGDSATVKVLGTGYQTATGVAPAGATLWVGESKQNFWRDPALANTDPNPFRLYPLPMPK